MKTNKGFTLAELLIVMAIIVVLAAVAIPTFGRQLETARETGDMELIRSAYTEALSVAVLDAADGKLDGKNGLTSLAASGPVTTTEDEAEAATTAAQEQAYTVTLATMDSAAKIKQTGTGWQYVNNLIVGVEVPQVITGTTTQVIFTFEMAKESDTSGNVRLVGNTGNIGAVEASGITTKASGDVYSGT